MPFGSPRTPSQRCQWTSPGSPPAPANLAPNISRLEVIAVNRPYGPSHLAVPPASPSSARASPQPPDPVEPLDPQLIRGIENERKSFFDQLFAKYENAAQHRTDALSEGSFALSDDADWAVDDLDPTSPIRLKNETFQEYVRAHALYADAHSVLSLGHYDQRDVIVDNDNFTGSDTDSSDDQAPSPRPTQSDLIDPVLADPRSSPKKIPPASTRTHEHGPPLSQRGAWPTADSPTAKAPTPASSRVIPPCSSAHPRRTLKAKPTPTSKVAPTPAWPHRTQPCSPPGSPGALKPGPNPTSKAPTPSLLRTTQLSPSTIQRGTSRLTLRRVPKARTPSSTRPKGEEGPSESGDRVSAPLVTTPKSTRSPQSHVNTSMEVKSTHRSVSKKGTESRKSPKMPTRSSPRIKERSMRLEESVSGISEADETLPTPPNQSRSFVFGRADSLSVMKRAHINRRIQSQSLIESPRLPLEPTPTTIVTPPQNVNFILGRKGSLAVLKSLAEKPSVSLPGRSGSRPTTPSGLLDKLFESPRTPPPTKVHDYSLPSFEAFQHRLLQPQSSSRANSPQVRNSSMISDSPDGASGCGTTLSVKRFRMRKAKISM